MINFAANLNKMINAGLGGPLDPPRTEVAVGHRVVYTEASGAVASFETNVIAAVKNLRVTMEPIQAGSGDPSPENIRPITGRNSVTVNRTGVNLWGGDRWYDSGASADRENRTVSGTNASNLPLITLMAFKPNTAYTFIVTMTSTASNGHTGYRFGYTDGSYTNLTNSNIGSTKATFVFVSNASKTLSSIQRVSYSGTKTYWVDESGIFEGNLTAAEFVPYDGQSVTIQLGTTVYGGTVDVTGGGALKTMDICDLSALTWLYYAADNYFYASMGNRFPNGTNGKGFCSSYKFYGTAISATLASMPDMNFGFTSNSGSKYIYIKDSRYTDAASFQTAVAGVQLVYDLQPSSYEEITTEPTTLSTVKGQNNVWSDAGNISLEYPCYEETEGY